jgi:predicted ATP-binding protein involved in virulence
MRVEKLELSNFRALQHYEREFDEHFNVVIGVNGIGKTSILDALAVQLSRVLPRATPAQGGHRRCWQSDVRSGSDSLTIRLRLQLGGQAVSVGMTDTSDPHRKWPQEELPRRELRDIASRYESKSPESKIGVPIALYFTTDRASTQYSGRRPIRPPIGRAAAYYRALREKTIDYRSFVEWLRGRLVMAGEQHEPDRRLVEIVSAAVYRFLPGFTDMEADGDPPRLYLRKNGMRVNVDQLSDGERSFLAMVVDISRHLAQANPGVQNPLQEGTGVVLIDELELHLHPKWQREVVENLQRTFPKLQFITTTHSPFVIQALKEGQLIDLEPEKNRGEFADKSIEDIAEYVMGVRMPQKSERYRMMLAAAIRYYRMLRSERPSSPQELEVLKRRLDDLVMPFSDDPAYMALLRMEQAAVLSGGGHAPS